MQFSATSLLSEICLKICLKLKNYLLNKYRLHHWGLHCCIPFLHTRSLETTSFEHLVKLSSKLNNPDTSPRRYWSIINRFLNNKKMPIIPPVLLEGNLISDFEKKAELLNNHFASQCSLVKDASTLPNLEYKTDERLNYFQINQNSIL